MGPERPVPSYSQSVYVLVGAAELVLCPVSIMLFRVLKDTGSFGTYQGPEHTVGKENAVRLLDMKPANK